MNQKSYRCESGASSPPCSGSKSRKSPPGIAPPLIRREFHRAGKMNGRLPKPLQLNRFIQSTSDDPPTFQARRSRGIDSPRLRPPPGMQATQKNHAGQTTAGGSPPGANPHASQPNPNHPKPTTSSYYSPPPPHWATALEPSILTTTQ